LSANRTGRKLSLHQIAQASERSARTGIISGDGWSSGDDVTRRGEFTSSVVWCCCCCWDWRPRHLASAERKQCTQRLAQRKTTRIMLNCIRWKNF